MLSPSNDVIESGMLGKVLQIPHRRGPEGNTLRPVLIKCLSRRKPAVFHRLVLVERWLLPLWHLR
jgi:hypothetical protein